MSIIIFLLLGVNLLPSTRFINSNPSPHTLISCLHHHLVLTVSAFVVSGVPSWFRQSQSMLINVKLGHILVNCAQTITLVALIVQSSFSFPITVELLSPVFRPSSCFASFSNGLLAYFFVVPRLFLASWVYSILCLSSSGSFLWFDECVSRHYISIFVRLLGVILILK